MTAPNPITRWFTGLASGLLLSTTLATAHPGHEAPRGQGPLAGPFMTAQNSNQPPDSKMQSPAQRTTRTLTLSNGLDVSLTHDPDADTSAASIAVGAGHLYNPDSKPGLAHYLEHMLFQGTQKYPETGDFKAYLSRHNGDFNAFTKEGETNYFFQISHKAFVGALDRFSDFFKAPLFSEENAGREVSAIQSEYDKNIGARGWQFRHLRHMLSNPGHPLARFDIGSKDSLAGDNREALRDFFSKYYSATNMKLAVISNLPLDQQEALVRQHFNGLPSFKVEHPVIDPDFRAPLQGKYRSIFLKTNNNEPTLIMEFPTIRLSDYSDSKPDEILSAVIGDESKGSLLSLLKEAGLATSLTASSYTPDKNINAMTITIGLTEDGVKQHRDIMEAVFSYLNMLKRDGIKEYTFRQEQQMGAIHHRWSPPSEGSDYVYNQASAMLQYGLRDFQDKPFLIGKYDPEAYKRVLETMTPDNLTVFVMAQNLEVDTKDPVYESEYSYRLVGGDHYRRLAQPGEFKGLHYPKPNPYIPDNLALVNPEPGEVSTDGLPQLAVDGPIGKVWSQYDTRFQQPKGAMTLLLKTPMVSGNVSNYVKATLLQACVSEYMNEEAYPLSQAGLHYAIRVDDEGLQLRFSGYTQRLPELIRMVGKNITDCKLDQARFKILKDEHMRAFSNTPGEAIGSALLNFQKMLLPDFYTNTMKRAALRPLTLQDIRNYGAEVLRQAQVTGTAYGNWNRSDVKAMVETFLHDVGTQPLPARAVKPAPGVLLRTGDQVLLWNRVIDNNNGVLFSIHGGPLSPKAAIGMHILKDMIKADLYTQIRDIQQTGYIVDIDTDTTNDNMFMHLIVQSAEYGPGEIQRRLEAWIKRVPAIIENMSDEEFETHRQNFMANMHDKEDSIGERESILFDLAANKKANFRYYEDMAQTAENLTRQDIKDIAQKLFFGIDTARVVIQSQARLNKDPQPRGAFTSPEDYQIWYGGKALRDAKKPKPGPQLTQ